MQIAATGSAMMANFTLTGTSMGRSDFGQFAAESVQAARQRFRVLDGLSGEVERRHERRRLAAEAWPRTI